MTPRATYRLQLAPGFGFREAAAVVSHLAELGISHLYLSPVLQAAEGSTHGYDIVDPSRVSTDLGGEEAFTAFAATARDAGLALVLDIVPNHMSIAGSRNGWWLDVLENGPASYFAAFFDVDWSATSDDRVLLPILGERYGRALASGHLSIAWSNDAASAVASASYPPTFWVRTGSHRVPVSPRSVGGIVHRAGETIAHAELAYVGEALASLPSAHERSPAARLRRHEHRGVLLRRLDELARATPVREAIEAELAAINRDPIALDAILEAQNYRLAHWSVAGSQLSYRRFFDVTSLVGVRVEDPDVFAASHARVLVWLHDDTLDGVRVDHVDGLRDPAGYLTRLREAAGPDRWIVVEKILAPHEELPASWPVDGTTGYDFLDLVGRLFVDPAGESALTHLFVEYTKQRWDPVAARRVARRDVMTDALHAELARLTELAMRACATSPACRDYTRAEIEDALAEILAHYPVYRTYLGGSHPVATTVRVVRAASSDLATRSPAKSRLEAFADSRRPATRSEETTTSMRPVRDPAPLDAAETSGVTDDAAAREIDRARIAEAVASARRARPDLDSDLLAFFEAALAFELPSVEAQELATVAQQSTGPIVAKGDEDTLSYRAVRLLARSEVGADIAELSVAPADVHVWLARRRPHDMNATSTHDTKRGEDVRARIAVLSEIPSVWSATVAAWGERAASGWGALERDRPFELAMWQTLVGAWPLSVERARRYAEKATREARTRTSWRKPDERYESARDAWIERVYEDHALLDEIAQLAARIAPYGDRNSLAQLLLKLVAPGVPDFYQGGELRIATLVDPDNRDLYAPRAPASELDHAKLDITRRVLALRQRRPGLFEAAYTPIAARGLYAAHVFAFARGGELVAVVPRLGVTANGWVDTTLSIDGAWVDILTERHYTGGARPLADLWRERSVALLLRSTT